MLTLLLLLAGAGRGWAAVAAMPDVGPAIGGVTVPICHAGGPADGPAAPPSHDCCEACALGAAATLPVAPIPTPLRAVSHRFALQPGSVRVAVVARQRTPRLAQAPPV